MTEADYVFNSRVDESRVQYAEFEKLVELCKKGEALAGENEEELNSILQQLVEDKIDYSNNAFIDMIIKKNLCNCDDRLKQLLEKLKINDKKGAPSLGRAYPRYSDDSYYIEVDRDYLKQILLLSDYVAVLSRIWDDSEKNEKDEDNKTATAERVSDANQKQILGTFKKIALERFIENNEDTKEYRAFSLGLLFYEKIVGEEITDNFICRSNNIYEAAVAQLVGHEIGHHYYRHTDEKDKEKERKRLEEEYNMDSTQQMQVLEYQADKFGTNFALDYICKQYVKQADSVYIHQIVGIFIPMIVSIYRGGNGIFEDSEDHPSMLKRLVEIKWTLKRRTNTETFDNVMAYVSCLLDVLGINERIEAWRE